MANLYDQFDAQSEVKDLATSFGVGSNQLLKMAGDVYGLATGNMDNVVSRQGQENIDYLQRGKSQKLIDSETRRKAAVDMEEGTLNQALAYVRETFTDPRLFLSTTAEAAPSLVGAGGIGAGARVATGKVLAKVGAEKAAETATKVGVGTAVAAGAGMQGTSVGADQYKEIVELLSNMPEDQALKVPQIVQLVVEKNATLEEAKTALALDLARSTGALSALASIGTQMLPGGRTIEKALVGGAGKKIAGAALTRAGVGAIGEGLQESLEEGSGAGVKNLLARAVDPEREITKGMGEAMGAGFAGAGPIGAAAGAASSPSRPVLASETTAGMSSEPLASDAIPQETRTSTTDTPDLSLEGAGEMNTREVGSVLSARESAARGFTPDPSDIATAESVRRPQIEVSEEAAKAANAPVQEALDEWRTQNPDVGVNITVINDPNMRNTRNYGIRGYFDPNTGEVVINSAFTKPFEVESVVNHEWSHHTLSSEDGRAALVEFATRDIPQEELAALAKRYPNADNLTLVEEWIARNQEKSPGTFARIIAKIREWLNGKLGINMSNEEVARVMLRTLRERGAPVAEGSGEMRQSTTEQPISISERRAEALRAFKERNPRSDAVMDKGRLYSPKVRDRLKTLSSTGVVDRQALDSDVETNFPAASRVEIPTEETLPTLDEIRNAVDEPKRSKVGGAGNIPEGDLITVRQDVPAYTKYGVGVVTVRDSKGNTYYQPMVRFTDPVLKPTPRQEGIALFIGSGEDKDPAITVKGRMSLDQSMPPDLDTWTQVGYNPDRHSYMYDRETGDPVLSGSEAVQIGNTVFVKDPEFGQKKDFKYSVEDEPLDTASENLNKTPNEATSIQQEEPRPARALPKSRFYVSSDERGGDFAGAITEAARLHKKGAAVEVKSPEFYSDPENHLYFSEDGLAGAVVKPDGDLVSVFKHPDSTAKMRDILTDASQEATKLDGFDIDEFLPNYYSRFGFRPVARVTFNDDFAPPKWNFEENGRPDNVFMVRDPENKLGLPEYDAYSEVRDSVPLVSYEEALTLQQEAVDKVASEKPKGAVLASEKPSVSGQSNVLSPSATDTVTMKPFKYSVEDEPKAGSKKAVRTPNEAVRKLSDDYNAQMGLGPIKHGHYVNFDEATARKIAKAYDAMPEIDRSPETVKAYEALAKEVNDQWDFAVENLGITFEPWNEDGQPYANSREMMADVRNNNHLYFFRGGGKHEFMSQVDPETGLTSIDKLRAIHDLYGHAAEDYQFGPRGEENAWLKHSQMFTPEAQRALSVGTRGQNSWVNFGDQNYENGVNKNIPAKDRPYAPQKMALLPEELTDWRSALGQSEPERSSVLAKQPIRESLTSEQIDAVDKRQIRELDIDDLVSRGILTDRDGKLLTELVITSGGDSRIEVVNPEDLPPRAAAVYDPNTNTIRVSKDAKLNLGRVLMHEYTHALTFMGLKYADERMTSRGDIISATPRPGVDIRDLREASRQMDELFSIAEKAANNLGEKFYGLSNRMEFVAEAFSSKKFQDFLSSIPSTTGGKQSLFDRFIAIVKKVLGTENDSLLTDVITATDPFVGAKKRVTGTLMISEDSPALPDEPSEPERSSVLAKQPIRESLTDDPVERVPEEGDPDYEEPVDTSSVLNAAAKRRERDDLPPTSALNTLYAEDSSIPLPSQGKRTNGQVAAQLREAAREHWGRDLDSSNITPEEIDGVVANGVEEVLAGLKASNHAGNWYTTAIRKAMAIAGILHPELNDDALAQKAGFKDAHAAEVGLATAMAITSQNLNVQKNTQYANEQFNILKKTGRFDPSKEYGSKLEAVSGNLSLANAMLDRVGWDGMEDFLNREYTVRELNDVASKLLGRKINISGKVDDVVNGSAIFGPKIGGGFFQNLRGNFNPVTVDLWMRRTWGRWTGDVLPDPLDAKRLARMIDGMRESGIPLPEELRSIRTIIAKSGRKVSTLSDAAAERVLSNPEAVTAAYDFAAQQDSRWNKIYSEVRQNITPEQAEAVRNGSLSLEKLNRDQQKSIREKKTAWQDLEDRPSSSSKEGKLAQEKLFAEMDKAAGRTAILTNEELSDNKPEWAKSSRVIKTLLKPVDVPSDIDRRVIVDVVNRIRNELNRQGVTATNADIQAILWYPEKDLWAKLAGKKESNLKNSYDEEFLKVAQSQGLGERARAAAARVGDAAP